MPPRTQGIKREKLLDVAEELFSLRGHASVTLRDIATTLGLHHASLYHYVPGGKDELYLEVMERNLERHRIGIFASVRASEGDLRTQLRATGLWLFSQPLLDMARMANADARGLGKRGEALLWKAYACFTQPLVEAFGQANARGQLSFIDFATAAISFVTMVEGLHSVPMQFFVNESKTEALEKILDIFLLGILQGRTQAEAKKETI